MSIITCLKELEEKGKLEHNDIVEFIIKEKILKYHVKYSYLFISNYHNDKIFKILKIEKYKLAEKIYKYKPFNIDSTFSDINWPEALIEDFPALTRLVKELYRIIEERKPVYTKFTRFEIMEI